MSHSIKAEGFVIDFIKEYVGRGFGTLSKRDFEVLIFHLLHKHGYFGSHISFFDASKKLRISESRVRNLFQDVQLRYAQYTDQEAREHFVKVIEERRFEVDSKKRYRFQIRDPLLHQYLEEWVDSVNGIADSSFSPTVVVISRKVLLDVIETLTPHNGPKDILEALPDNIGESVRNKKTRRAILGQFLDKYIDTLAEGTARTTIGLAGMGLRALLGILA